ncbi:hypothetical protein [Rubrivivax gelatinosus]|uniref:Bacteriophage Rz lysis protein n=1 Tax=Rubrivivax gelatinosus TaxID=28068 RepID=A0ABS1DPB3_RUBGE|nr:hypothetical protein [Rubrivivax gelatinosus]MBK1711308.1 hypothetical protein [Rubrivivax gelatinosus]
MNRLTIVAIAALATLSSGLIAWGLGSASGAADARIACSAAEDRTTATHAEAAASAATGVLYTERDVRQQLDDLAAALRKDFDRERSSRAAVAAAVRAGAVRLSIPVAAAAPGGAACSAAAAASAGDRHEARADIAPEAGLALAAIADEGDDAIRQLNTCIDAYNGARARLAGEQLTEAR